MWNFVQHPFADDEPSRGVTARDAHGDSWSSDADGDSPTTTVKAVLRYGDLKWEAQVLPGGALEVSAMGSGYPKIMTQHDGASNVIQLVPRELFDGPLWKHPGRPSVEQELELARAELRDKIDALGEARADVETLADRVGALGREIAEIVARNRP
jgi:hypothetical protein